MLRSTLAKLAVPVPDDISEAFDILRARRLVGQCRLLYLGLIATIPPAIIGGSDAAPRWAAMWLPIAIGVLLALGFAMLVPIRADRITARFARRFIVDATWSSPLVGCLCALWCAMNWWYAPDHLRAYYPMVLALGSLATSYCLASVRPAAILNMLVGPVPIAALMLLSGHTMDAVAAVSLLVATGFLFRLTHDQHKQLVELLTLQHAVQRQADTDPLTGLLNRRALDTILAGRQDAFALALLDLDGFKPVNDRYGHGTGDALLCAVGERLRAAAGPAARVARLGGDEFAVFVPDDRATGAGSLAGRLLSVFIAPFDIDGDMIRIGASVGVSRCPEDGTDRKKLYAKADTALYAVKNEHRGAGHTRPVVKTAA